MKKREYTLSDLVGNEAYDFAKYTVEQRAIPSMIDGFKPVHRFFITSAIRTARTEYKKVAGIAGIVADYGYRHGENSAAEAGSLMAADWNVNVCLIEGRGRFGSRKVPEPGAPRYIYARLNEPVFNKYYGDNDLLQPDPDPEVTIPRYYIPVIPMVLVNGIRGIATGFATHIPPHCPESVASKCLEYIQTGKIAEDPDVKYPLFTGPIEIQEKRIMTYGAFERKDTSTIHITELPPETDHLSYIRHLDKLVAEDDNVTRYEDRSDNNGFAFTVKMKRAYLSKASDTDLLKLFRLSKPFSPNLTVIDENGKVRVYQSTKDLIVDFVEWRMEAVLPKRIENGLEKSNHQYRFLSAWKWLVMAINDGSVDITKVDDSDLKWVPSEHHEYIPSLLGRPIRTIMRQGIVDLENRMDLAVKDIEYWTKTNPKKEFLKDLKGI